MVIFLIVLIFSSCQFICQAEEVEFEVDSINCNDTNDCDLNDCFKKYNELHFYVINNKDLLNKLTVAFYRTGEEPSEFVRITCEFQVCDCNSTNNNEDDYDYDIMEEGLEEGAYCNCTNTTELYIWSTSALYLLGPDPLFWLTLFAVNIPEASVTIQLPRLCKGPKNDLLSRLTYLVRQSSVNKTLCIITFSYHALLLS